MILEQLRKNNIPAVTSCDFEDLICDEMIVMIKLKDDEEGKEYSGQRLEKQNKPRKSRTGLKIIVSLCLIIISSSLLLYAIVTDRLVLTSWPIKLLYIPIIVLVLMWIPSDIKRRSAGQKWLFGIIFFFILILLIFGGIFGMVFLVSYCK
jgi:hypothetical protein